MVLNGEKKHGFHVRDEQFAILTANGFLGIENWYEKTLSLWIELVKTCNWLNMSKSATIVVVYHVVYRPYFCRFWDFRLGVNVMYLAPVPVQWTVFTIHKG